MLILQRSPGESLFITREIGRITEEIEIIYLKHQSKNTARLGIIAPGDYRIFRSELDERKIRNEMA